MGYDAGGRSGLEHRVQFGAKVKAPQWGTWEMKVGKLTWGPTPKALNASPDTGTSSFKYSRKHQKHKICLPHIFRLSLKYSEYHEISIREENNYFCSLEKIVSFSQFQVELIKLEVWASPFHVLQAGFSSWPTLDLENNK